MQTDLMRGALDFVDSGPFDVAHRTSFDAAEAALARQSDGTRPAGLSSASIFDDDDLESFGARLRRVRERRGISIASIAESTKILGALLEGVENNDVSRWPTGLYRRAFMRAYATAIGLDPEPIVREFIARFPDPEDTPLPVPAAPAAPLPGTRAVLRLTLAEPSGTFAGGDLLREARRRVTAIAADAVVVGGIAAGLYLVVDAFWAPLALAIAVYYFGSILVLGNTPGVCLVASHASDPVLSGWTSGGRASRRTWTRVAHVANRVRSASGNRWRTWLGRD